MLNLTTLSDQTLHYAAVRARLWTPPPRHQLAPIIVTAEPELPAIDERRVWSAPLVIEAADGEPQRIAAALDAIERAPYITARLVATIVAQAFDVTVEDVFGSSHRPKFSHPRQVAMTIAYHRLSGRWNGTLAAIGRAFNRDHTTVMHAIRKYGALVERVSATLQSEQ